MQESNLILAAPVADVHSADGQQSSGDGAEVGTGIFSDFIHVCVCVCVCVCSVCVCG